MKNLESVVSQIAPKATSEEYLSGRNPHDNIVTANEETQGVREKKGTKKGNMRYEDWGNRGLSRGLRPTRLRLGECFRMA